MSRKQPIVFVIDDDRSIRESLESLFRSVGLDVRCFESTQAFLKADRPDEPSCLVLDVRLPGLSGLDFQGELKKSKIEFPIVFVSGHGDVPMTVRAIKAGAIEFLTKPFRDQDLLDAVQLGIERDRVRRREGAALAALQARLESLSAREREVMVLVATGRMNKQIAGDLDLSEVTVKVHRSNAMRKMGAKSVADLVRMVDRLGLGVPAQS
jgi:FixJ family two-component response regulator